VAVSSTEKVSATGRKGGDLLVCPAGYRSLSLKALVHRTDKGLCFFGEGISKRSVLIDLGVPGWCRREMARGFPMKISALAKRIRTPRLI